MPTPGILRQLRIKRVSLVDMGANFDTKTGDGAHIMLYKRAVEKDGPSLSAVHADSPEWDAQDMDEYEKADLTAEGRRRLPDSAFAAVWTDAQGKKHRKLPIHDAGHLAAARGRIDQAQMPADVKARARRKLERAGKKEKPVAKTFKEIIKSALGLMEEPDAEVRKTAVASLTKAVDDLPDVILKDSADGDGDEHDPSDEMCKCAKCMTKRNLKKGADEVIEKKLTDLEKSNNDLRQQLAVEKSMRQQGEMREILKGFKATAFVLEGEDNDVEKFVKMRETDPSGYKRTMALLKAADEQVSKSLLFQKEIGSGLSGTGSAYDQLVAKAQALVEKSTDSNMTFEKAMDKVQLQFPDLVKQYRAEQQ